jgi:hypothetical protein
MGTGIRSEGSGQVSAESIISLVVFVLVVAVVVAVVVALRRKQRTEALRGQFGKEYDRTVQEQGDQQAAERDLRERQLRRSTFAVRELDPLRRQQYTQAWDRTQAQFVDDPAAAVTAAHKLVREVMSERGYPTDDFERQADDVSVDHPEVVGDYREAVRISEASGRGEASTEDLREAMVHYRSLFAGLLQTQGSEGRNDR